MPDIEDELAKAKSKALTLLSYRQYSGGELTGRLIQEGFSEEAAVLTSEWAQSAGLISDLNYACSVLASLKRRGFGLVKIRSEFKRRRLSQEMLDDVLSEADYDESAEAAAAAESAARDFAGHALSFDERRKLYGSLSRKGFTSHAATAAIKELTESHT